jgi:hypothetical protein
MKNILKYIVIIITMFAEFSAHATNYYYCNNSPAKVTTLTSWKNNSNCTGASPSSFSNSSDVFYINKTVNINQIWSVSGKVIINSSCNISGNGEIISTSIDLGDNSTININNSNIPTFSNISLTSTVIINNTSSYNLPQANYGSVLLFGNNTNITLIGNTSIEYLLLDTCILNLNGFKLIIADDYEYLRKSIFIGSSNSELYLDVNGILTSPITFSQISLSNKTIKSLKLNGTTATIDSSLYITHLLDLTAYSSSNLITNNNLYLLANSNYTAQVANMTNCSITGKIHYQIYIPASGGRYWHHITAPLDSVTVSQWQAGASTNNGIYVTGTFTGASNPGNGIVQSGISCYSWNSITQTWSNFPKVNNSEYINNSTGYRFFIRNGSAALAPTTPAKIINNFGYVKSGTIEFPLNYDIVKGGWNLLGNPYPANITADLSNSSWSYNGLANSTVWMWNSQAGVYVACNNGVGDCIIPSGQSFWVESNTIGATAQINENAKILTYKSLYKKSSVNDYFNVKLTNNTSNVNNDYYLRLSSNYTDTIDIYDAVQRWETFQNTIYVSISGVDKYNNFYNIDSRKDIKNTDTIGIYVITSQGNNTLSFLRSGFSYTGNIYLHDKYLDSTLLIDSDLTYQFAVTSNTSTKNNRFYLTFYETPVITNITKSNNIEIIKIYPNPSNYYFQIKSDLNINKIEILNNSGQLILSKNINDVNDIISHNLSNGVYNVKIYTIDNVYLNKIVICR